MKKRRYLGGIEHIERHVEKGALMGLNPASFTTANSFVRYPIDTNRFVLMSIDPGVLSLGMMESVKP